MRLLWSPKKNRQNGDEILPEVRGNCLTVRVWVVWDYEALPCQNNKNLNTRTNVEYTENTHITYTQC